MYKIRRLTWFLMVHAVLILAFVACGSESESTPTPPAIIGGDSYISGVVTNAEGERIEGVRVSIVSGTAAFPEVAPETDKEGFYRLSSLAAGRYEVAVHDAQGQRIALESVAVLASGPADLNIVVTEAAPAAETAAKATESNIPPGMTFTPKGKAMQYSAPPPMTIDPNGKYTATFHMEKGGEIVIELYAKEAPMTVNSFVFLAREGFYDGVTFHRVIPGFMAQGGDPTGTGTGGPGYTFESELTPLRRHDGPGVLSMANAGGLATNGSQFFITFGATPGLDGYGPDGSLKPCAAPRVSCHTVFGKVIEGMDVVKGISPRDPSTAASPGDVMTTIAIEESD